MVNRSTWYQVPPTISTILCSVMLIFSIATFLDTTVKVWSKLRMLVWQNKQINKWTNERIKTAFFSHRAKYFDKITLAAWLKHPKFELARCQLAWENSWHCATPPLVSPTLEKLAEKFHTDHASLPRSRECFWLIKSASSNQKHFPHLCCDTSSVWTFFTPSHFLGKPVVALRNVGCFLKLLKKLKCWIFYYYTCNELKIVKMYWNTSPASVTLRTPNTQVSPRRGNKTTHALTPCRTLSRWDVLSACILRISWTTRASKTEFICVETMHENKIFFDGRNFRPCFFFSLRSWQ